MSPSQDKYVELERIVWCRSESPLVKAAALDNCMTGSGETQARQSREDLMRRIGTVA